MKHDALGPLCVDLDGTLTPTDTLAEALSIVVVRRPWLVPVCLWALREGRAAFKHSVVRCAAYTTAGIPRTLAVQTLIESQFRERPIWLVSGAPQELVDEVVSTDHRITRGVGSTATMNLTSSNKRDFLIAHSGPSGFDYVGNSTDDIPVWKACNVSYGVNLSHATRRRVQREEIPLKELMPLEETARAGLLSLRPFSWIKNLLVFVPLLASHQWQDVSIWEPAIVAFVALCIGSTTVYLLNDMADLAADRRHPTKSLRPLASGRLHPLEAWFAVLLLLGAWIGFAAALDATPRILLAAQLATSLMYSGLLKRIPILDVTVLAMLFCNRVLIGGTASKIQLSSWLLAFSLFVFLSLAGMKRFCELKIRPSNGEGAEALGHSYNEGDGLFLVALGVNSMLLSVLILALYLGDIRSESLYSRPEFLWGLCLCLLLWGIRMWMRAWRGEITDDPLREALRLPETWISILVCTLAFVASV